MLNTAVGILLIVLGVLFLLLAFAIFFKKYVLSSQVRMATLADAPQPPIWLSLALKIVELLDKWIGAPPEFFCFIGGLILMGGGIAVLIYTPM
jgi:hypothetical protein